MAEENISTRICGRCKAELPIEQFSLRKKGGSSCHSQCKKCCSEMQKAWKAANPGQVAKNRRRWRKQRPDLYRAAQKRSKLKNREKILAANKEYSRRNKEKIRLKNQAWNQANRDEAKRRAYSWRARNLVRFRTIGGNYRARKRLAVGRYTKDDIERIYALQRGRCANCCRVVGLKYHVDHVKAISKGGSNNPSNLQILCGKCNVKKWNLDPLEFARRNGRLL